MTTKYEPCSCMSKGIGSCLYVACCGCLAVKDALEAVGDDSGIIHCLGFFPFSCFKCCSLCSASRIIADKVGIEATDAELACYSCLDPCVCLGCSTYNAAMEYKEKGGATASPAAKPMDRE